MGKSIAGPFAWNMLKRRMFQDIRERFFETKFCRAFPLKLVQFTPGVHSSS
jgi:hypothetical protein